MATTIADVAAAVALRTGITVVDMCGPRRSREISLARWAAWYELHKMGTKSLPQIGRYFNKDHTSVLYGIRRFEELGLHKTDGEK